MEPEKKLAELEARVEKAELSNQRELADLRDRLDEANAELGDMRQRWMDGAELTKALENQVRERNEQILQLAKDAEFGGKFRELLSQLVPPSVSAGAAGKEMLLADVKWEVAVKDEVRQVEASDTTNCRGRLLKLGSLGFFDERRTFAEIAQEFPRRGWPDSEKTLSNTLVALFADGLIAREKPGQGKAIVYWKPDGVLFKKAQ